ncbi:hypothetical protein D3C76_1035480 [compost metagenome]
MQGDRQPDLLDVVIAQPVGLEERRCRVGAVDFETFVVAAITFHQAQVMEHRAYIQKLRVVGQLLALAAQRAEQKHPARVVVEQVGFDVADVFGGGFGQGAVGDLDAGDGGAHGLFLKVSAGAALRVKVCSRPANGTIDPWLRSLPMSMHIVPTSLVGRRLDRVASDLFQC